MALKNSKKKIIKASVALVTVLLFLFVIAPYSVTAIVLNVVFGRRFETAEHLRFYESDFPELQSERYTFGSCGRQLVGYRYFFNGVTPRGLVVLVHGFGGGGHNGYMDVAYFFVQRGYEVFGYDAAGNDESEGKVNGLPQGVQNLNGALAYAKSLPQCANLPVVLWGHSWGGYSAVCSLLYDNTVRAVASVSSFNSASDLMEARGVQYGGFWAKALTPYLRSVERMRFGSYAAARGVNAIEKSDAGVFIAHGTADTVVPMRYGYDVYYERFSSLPRVKFYKAENKGHTEILYSDEGWAYTRTLIGSLASALTEEARKEVIASIDRAAFSSRLNLQLFEQIADFYDLYTQEEQE